MSKQPTVLGTIPDPIPDPGQHSTEPVSARTGWEASGVHRPLSQGRLGGQDKNTCSQHSTRSVQHLKRRNPEVERQHSGEGTGLAN